MEVLIANVQSGLVWWRKPREMDVDPTWHFNPRNPAGVSEWRRDYCEQHIQNRTATRKIVKGLGDTMKSVCKHAPCDSLIS